MPGQSYIENLTLTTNDCFEVTINDSYGDGIYSTGGYSLTDATGAVGDITFVYTGDIG